ncbi:MAG: pilus assembly protein CpaE [Caulobacteraceae bacterium]|nr:pilus assembly protein CpaE [Caulobacteraceae bacterium]
MIGSRNKLDEAFDLGFEADDDFSAFTPPPEPEVRASEFQADGLDEDFSAFPPAPSHDHEPLPLLAEPAPARVVNPVGDLISSAEAALGEPGVPRITVHAFVETGETAELVEKAAGDRRMRRATCTVRGGGLAAALEHYSNQSTPSLLLIESLDAAQVLVDGLDRLAEVCDPGTKVVVVGGANDISLYRALMARGVSEYLSLPLNDPLQIVRAISTLYADPSQPFLGRQVAVVAARGGAGASTVAHNLAHSLAEHIQAGSVLVDFDLPFGTAGLNFNQDPLQGVADALGAPDRLDPQLMDRMLVRCTDRLSLFASPANLDNDYEMAAEAYEEVAQKVRAAASFVILDMPYSWTSWKRRILIAADELVVVATPDLASLRNAKNIIDLVRHARPNDAPPRLVLNQVGVPGRPEIPVKDFGEALGLTPSLVLPFEPKLFGQAANNGQMLSEVAPKAKATEGVNHLAELIARREAPPAVKKSLFASLFKKG